MGDHHRCSGRRVWRPVAVAVVVSAAGFLPQGVAVAATPGTIDTVTCSQISAELRNGSLNCSPLKHDGVDGVFIGPVSSTGSPARRDDVGQRDHIGFDRFDRFDTDDDHADHHPAGYRRLVGRQHGRLRLRQLGRRRFRQRLGQRLRFRLRSDSDSDDNGSSGSGSSGSDGSDDSSGSSSAAARRVSSSGGSSSYSTNSGVTLGAAACPAGVGGTTSTAGHRLGRHGRDHVGHFDHLGHSGLAHHHRHVRCRERHRRDRRSRQRPGQHRRHGDRTTSPPRPAPRCRRWPARSRTRPPRSRATRTCPPTSSTSGTGTSPCRPASRGDPDTIENPKLAKFTNEFFKLDDTRDGVVFTARGRRRHHEEQPLPALRAAGDERQREGLVEQHQRHAHPRRVRGDHQGARAKPEVVGAQIHDGSDDVMQIRLEGQKLMVQYDDGKSETVIDPNYVLGTPYNVRIVAADGKVDVLYNGAEEGRAAAVGLRLVLEGRRLRPVQRQQGRGRRRHRRGHRLLPEVRARLTG